MKSKYVTRAAVVQMLRDKAEILRRTGAALSRGVGSSWEEAAYCYERAADLVETFNDLEAEEFFEEVTIIEKVGELSVTNIRRRVSSIEWGPEQEAQAIQFMEENKGLMEDLAEHDKKTRRG